MSTNVGAKVRDGSLPQRVGVGRVKAVVGDKSRKLKRSTASKRNAVVPLLIECRGSSHDAGDA
jgi:hypothetical protein